MRREYTVADFTSLLDYLLKQSVILSISLCIFSNLLYSLCILSVPGLSIATDIICGFPSETEDVNLFIEIFCIIIFCLLLGFRGDYEASSVLQVSQSVHQPVLPSTRDTGRQDEENTNPDSEKSLL